MHYIRGEYDRVLKLATDNLAMLPADSVYEYFGIGAPPSVFDRTWMVMSLAQLGRFAEAARHEAEAMRLAESTHHAHTIAIAYRAAVTLHVLRGDWTKARSLAESAIAVTVPTGHMLLASTAFAASAWVVAQLGEASEALDRLREAEQLLERRLAKGVDAERSWDYQALGRACLLLGRRGEAQTWVSARLNPVRSKPDTWRTRSTCKATSRPILTVAT
jgi:tetratricopeptide (TPR) repeat protein